MEGGGTHDDAKVLYKKLHGESVVLAEEENLQQELI